MWEADRQMKPAATSWHDARPGIGLAWILPVGPVKIRLWKIWLEEIGPEMGSRPHRRTWFKGIMEDWR
jgi:hypothetical protein